MASEPNCSAADSRGVIFLDGTGVTPGSEVCQCSHDCEFPCWQRLGLAPPCESCGCGSPEAVTSEAVPPDKEKVSSGG